MLIRWAGELGFVYPEVDMHVLCKEHALNLAKLRGVLAVIIIMMSPGCGQHRCSRQQCSITVTHGGWRQLRVHAQPCVQG
jgi:hypothetical protein